MHILQTILLVAPLLLLSVIAHEIAHGYAALLQGDRTALDAGRLSWNPARHIDLRMTILLPLVMLISSSMFGRPVMFGGAKPVPVNPANYKHIRRGDIIVSLAGVATNFVLALFCGVMIVLTGLLARNVTTLETSIGILQAMLILGVQMNFILIAFNLIPIPPLDGSHVMKYLLPRPLAIRYVQFGRYGILILFLLLMMGNGFLNFWLTPAFAATDRMITSVEPYVVAGAGEWLK